MSALDDVRNRLTEFYTSTVLDAIGVHAVTFQPLRSHPNEDRMVLKEWDIEGDKWLFLAVCDGHGGAATSEFTANTLPARIRNALCQLTQIEFSGLLDRDNVDDGENVSSMLRKEILSFDHDIGKAVKKICRKPGDLTEERAKALVQQHPEALQRALCGTTLAAAIVNISRQFMWAVGVGDSTAALCTNTDGKHNCQRLTDMHTPKNPQEYFRVAMAHPAAEKDVLFADRVIGFISITRTLGDFTLKFHRTFLTHLFRFMSATFGDIEGFSERIFTPPYLIANPQ